MTKLRAPASFEQALTRIAGVIGWDRMAGALTRPDRQITERAVRNWSEPDTPASISIADARLLDTAYRTAGGDGYPLHDAYRVQLDVAEVAAGADTEALARLTALVAKEGGEAIAALMPATRPGATRADRAIAAREVTEAIAALQCTLPMLDPAGGSVGSGDVPGGTS